MPIACASFLAAMAGPPDLPDPAATEAAVLAEPSAWVEADRLAGEGRHDEAAAAYGRAWDEEGAVVILYSWAQAERLRGQCERAVDLYTRFVDAADTPPPDYEGEVMRARFSDMRANAERQREGCRAQLAEQARAREPEPPAASEPLPPEPQPTPTTAPVDASASPWWRDGWGWSLVSIGAASLVAGGSLVGIAAWRDAQADGRGTHEDFLDAIDRATIEQRVGIGLLAVGGAFVVAGAARLGLVARATRRRTGIALTAAPRLGIAVTGRF